MKEGLPCLSFSLISHRHHHCSDPFQPHVEVTKTLSGLLSPTSPLSNLICLSPDQSSQNIASTVTLFWFKSIRCLQVKMKNSYPNLPISLWSVPLPIFPDFYLTSLRNPPSPIDVYIQVYPCTTVPVVYSIIPRVPFISESMWMTPLELDRHKWCDQTWQPREHPLQVLLCYFPPLIKHLLCLECPPLVSTCLYLATITHLYSPTSLLYPATMICIPEFL